MGLGHQNQVVGLGGKFPQFQNDRIFKAQIRANEELGRYQGKAPHSQTTLRSLGALKGPHKADAGILSIQGKIY